MHFDGMLTIFLDLTPKFLANALSYSSSSSSILSSYFNNNNKKILHFYFSFCLCSSFLESSSYFLLLSLILSCWNDSINISPFIWYILQAWIESSVKFPQFSKPYISRILAILLHLISLSRWVTITLNPFKFHSKLVLMVLRRTRYDLC